MIIDISKTPAVQTEPLNRQSDAVTGWLQDEVNKRRAWRYRSKEEFLLQHGTVLPVPVAIPSDLRKSRSRSASDLFEKNPSLMFIQGYVRDRWGDYREEEWCFDVEGRMFGYPFPGEVQLECFGVVFRREYIARCAEEGNSGYFMGHIDLFGGEAPPLLTGAHQPEDALFPLA